MINNKRKKGFTLPELLVSSFIALFIFLCAWAMYMIGWAWWYEILPQTECQRIARAAVSVIRQGMIDSTVGTDTINSVLYRKRNGVEESLRTRSDVLSGTFVTPTITDSGHRINFKLEPDPTGVNSRSYYLAQDANGVKAVYYQYSATAPQMINATRLQTSPPDTDMDIVFEGPTITEDGYTYNNLIKVTATVQKTVKGSRSTPYVVSVIYTDYINLRNL